MQSSIPPSDYPALTQRSTHAKSARFNSWRIKGARGPAGALGTIGPATSIAEDLPLRQGGVIGRRLAQLWQIPYNAQSIRLEQTWELPLSSVAAVKAGIWEIQWLENSAAAAIGRRLPIKKLCSSTVPAVPPSWK